MDSLKTLLSDNFGLSSFIASPFITLFMWYCSPEWVKRRFTRVTSWLLRRHPSVAVEHYVAVFNGHVEMLTDARLSNPADAIRQQQFYEMAPLDWGIIAANADIERDEQAGLIEKLSEGALSFRVFCIHGEPGSGKSTLAWRVAAELHKQYRALVIRVIDNEDPEVWYRMPEFCRTVGRPLYVLVDDLFRSPEVVRALGGLDPSLPLTVLATSQSNENRPVRIKGQLVPIKLGRPSRGEKDRVLRRLGRARGGLNRDQLDRMNSASEFLVLMVELTSGRGFEEVIQASLDNLFLRHESVYRAYEYLCFSYSYGIAIPASLLERLDDMGKFQGLPDKEGAQGLVFYVESRVDLVRPGHRRRAEAARRLFAKNHRASEIVLRELVKVVNGSSSFERTYIALLLCAWARNERRDAATVLFDVQEEVSQLSSRASTLREWGVWRALYLGLGRHNEAEGCLAAALAMEPVTAHECTLTLKLYRDGGREAAALPVLERWIRAHREWGEAGPAYLWLVGRYGSQTQQEELIGETRSWLAAHADDTSVRTAYLSFVEKRGAAKHVEGILEETGRWLAAHADDTSVRTAYLSFVEQRGAAKHVEGVLQETGRWLAAHGDDSHVRTAYLSLVEQRGAAKHVEAILQETGRWLAAHSDDTSVRTAYLSLVEARETADQVDRVFREMSNWLSAHPDAVNVWDCVISHFCAVGKLDDARTLTEQAVKTHPRNSSLAHRYLTLMDGCLDEQGARDLYGFLISSFPLDELFKQKWARWLHGHGHSDEAESMLTRLLEMHPKSSKYHYSFGEVLLDSARYEDAAHHFRQASYFAGRRHAMAYLCLGQAVHGQARLAEAEGNHEKAERLLVTAENELKRAIDAALRHNEPKAKFYTQLGWFYIDRKRWADARGAFERAQRENVDHFENYWGQGHALLGLEQWDAAASALHTALEKAPCSLGPPASIEIPRLIERSETALRDQSRAKSI